MVSPVKRARGLRPRATRNAPGTIRTCDLCLRSGPSERAEIANVPPVVLAEVKVDVCPPEVRHRCADLTGEFLDLNLVLAVLLKPIRGGVRVTARMTSSSLARAGSSRSSSKGHQCTPAAFRSRTSSRHRSSTLRDPVVQVRRTWPQSRTADHRTGLPVSSFAISSHQTFSFLSKRPISRVVGFG